MSSDPVNIIDAEMLVGFHTLGMIPVRQSQFIDPTKLYQVVHARNGTIEMILVHPERWCEFVHLMRIPEHAARDAG